MRVVDFLAREAILPSLSGKSKGEVLTELSLFLARQQPGIDAQALRRAIEEREQLASTAIGDGIAIPHGKLDTLDRLVGALGRSVSGVDCNSIDGRPTHLLFMLVAPTNSAGAHLKALARLSRLFRDGAFRQKLLDAPDSATMYQIIAEEDAKY
jgi:PTS system nitrogen regulatory IIA component